MLGLVAGTAWGLAYPWLGPDGDVFLGVCVAVFVLGLMVLKGMGRRVVGVVALASLIAGILQGLWFGVAWKTGLWYLRLDADTAAWLHVDGESAYNAAHSTVFIGLSVATLVVMLCMLPVRRFVSGQGAPATSPPV